MKRYAAMLLTMMSPMLLVSCGESDEEKKEREAQFTTSSKMAPTPQLESLQDLISPDFNSMANQKKTPGFELYGVYNGEDMRQVTEVTGRTLLLCFTAPWCRHSNTMRESLKQLATDEKGSIQVVEIDADAYPSLAHEYNLTKVPTTVFFAEGIMLRSIEGAFTAESLRNYLHKLLTEQEAAQPEN